MVDAKSVCPIQACTVLKVDPSLKAHFNACFSRYDSSISSSFDRPLTSAFDDGVLPLRPLSLKLPPKLLIFCSQLSQRLEEGPHSVCFSIITQPQGVHPSVYLSRNCHDARFWSFVGSSHRKT